MHCGERLLGHPLAALIMLCQVDSLRFRLSVGAEQDEVRVVAFLEHDAQLRIVATRVRRVVDELLDRLE